MAKSAPPPPGDNEKKIADADWLVRDAPKSSPKPKPKAAPPAADSPQADDDHSYDLVDGEETTFRWDEPPAPPVPVAAPAAPAAAPKPRVKDEWEQDAADEDDADAAVEQVWSRGAEW